MMNKKLLIIFLILIIFLDLFLFFKKQKSAPSIVAPNIQSSISLPIDKAKERITKKFFGTFVTPANSPVSPEKFTGYHTGLDFETFPDEKDVLVPVKVICDGPLLQKRIASGYGGGSGSKVCYKQ